MAEQFIKEVEHQPQQPVSIERADKHEEHENDHTI